jgi:hypothetical protein
LHHGYPAVISLNTGRTFPLFIAAISAYVLARQAVIIFSAFSQIQKIACSHYDYLLGIIYDKRNIEIS